MDNQDEGVRSYRELLRYVLQEYETQGGRLQYPVGCLYLEDWLLDSLNVPKLLRYLQTEREISLVNLCEGEAGLSTIKTLTLNASGPLGQGVLAGAPSLGGQRSTMEASTSNRPESDLQLDLPSTGMTEDHLRYLAYTLFYGSCSSYCSEILTDSIREQLKISRESADSLQHLLSEAANLQSQAASSLEMITMLLQIGRPRHFDSFEAFSAWRQSYTSAVCQSLILGAAESMKTNGVHGGGSLRPDLLRMKMYMRMVDVPISEDYDEDVYSEGMAMAVRTASKVANMPGVGWVLPWAVKVKIAELLMAAGFDSQSGQAFPDHDVLMRILRHHLWPLLSLPMSLHDCLHAWAYIKIFSITGNTDLLAQGKELIEEIPRRQSTANGHAYGSNPFTSAPEPPQKMNNNDQFVDNAIKAIVKWTAGRLSNYRQTVDAGPIPSLLSVLFVCQRCLGQNSAKTSEILEKCIQNSVQAEFDNSMQALKDPDGSIPKDSNWIVRVAECCSELLDEEVSYYSPLFSAVLKRPAEISARKIHSCFNSFLIPFLQTVHTLDDENLEAIRAAVKLESRLQTLLGDDASSGCDWAILERLTPLLHLWVSNQLSMLNQWHLRLWESESWKAIGTHNCSSSAPELIKFAREMLELMFNLHLGIPDEVVTAACSGLDELFQRYVRGVAAEFWDPDFFVPPVPPLTRYKKDVKDKSISKPQKGYEAGNLRSWTAEQTRLAENSSTSLIVRLNSLQYIREQLSVLTQIVEDRYDIPEGQDGLWAERMFDTTRHETTRSVRVITTFLSVKVVFQELEEDLSHVYKHSVSGARVEGLLEVINDKLTFLMGKVHDEIRDTLALAFLQALVDAFLRILLHGGSDRFFQPNDVPLIEEDVATLKQFFYQGGDGIAMEDIDTTFTEVMSLLNVLELDTGTLVDNLKQIRQQQKMGQQVPTDNIQYDPQVLLPVLAHREDHAASKFLKKEYSLPKKIDSSGGFTRPGAKATVTSNTLPAKKKSGLFNFRR